MKRFFTAAAAACLAVALSSCDRGPSAPSPADALTGSLSSAHIDFRFAQNDNVDAPRQEAFHDWVVGHLGVTATQRLRYNKYRDRAHLERVTGHVTNGFAEPESWTVHSIWPWDAHEAVHVYTALIGRPSDFFNEGIAVALSFDPLDNRFVSLWNSTPIDNVARDFLRAGQLPTVAAMMETSAFRAMSDGVTYPASGSFVSFLLRERGMPAMRVYFQTGTRNDSAATIQSRFGTAFGFSIAEADQQWRAYLSGL
jgi:hypothetical protein